MDKVNFYWQSWLPAREIVERAVLERYKVRTEWGRSARNSISVKKTLFGSKRNDRPWQSIARDIFSMRLFIVVATIHSIVWGITKHMSAVWPTFPLGPSSFLKSFVYSGSELSLSSGAPLTELSVDQMKSEEKPRHEYYHDAL